MNDALVLNLGLLAVGIVVGVALTLWRAMPKLRHYRTCLAAAECEQVGTAVFDLVECFFGERWDWRSHLEVAKSIRRVISSVSERAALLHVDGLSDPVVIW